jgi:hypothetical protein
MSVRDLARFVVRTRVNHYRNHPISALWAACVITLAITYGLGIVYLVQAYPELREEVQKVVAIANLTVAMVILLANLVPTFRPTTAALPAFYAIPQWIRGIFGTIFDVLGLAAASAVLFFGILLLLPSYRVAELITSLVALVAVMMAERSIRLLIELRLPYRWAHGAALALLIWGGGWVLVRLDTSPLAMSALGAIAGLATLQQGWLAHLSAGDVDVTLDSLARALVPAPRTRPRGWILTVASMSLRSARIWPPLGIGLTLKIFTLFFFGRIMATSSGPALPPFFFYLVASPIVVYSYALNNTFGHIAGLWDTVQIHGAGALPVWRVYASALLIPCLLDAAIAIGAASYLSRLTVQFATAYAGGLLLLISIGFVSSVVDPRRVGTNTLLSLRSNTSVWFTLLFSVPAASLFASAVHSPYLPLLVGLAVAVLLLVGMTSRWWLPVLAPWTYHRLRT